MVNDVSATRGPRLRVVGPQRYGVAIGVVAVATLADLSLYSHIGEANLVMVYLLGVMLSAAWLGRGPSILASVVSVLAFDFFFAPPIFSFAFDDPGYIVTFSTMLAVAMVISTLTTRVREQAENAEERARRTAAMYSLSRDVSAAGSLDGLVEAAVRNIDAVLESHVVIFLPTADGTLRPQGGSPVDSHELGVAGWAFEHAQPAGLGTATLPTAEAMYVPLVASQKTVGVLGLQPRGTVPSSTEQQHLLETLVSHTALAIERFQLLADQRATQMRMETEQLRSSLLSSVSHDLRTPLASIMGAASTLVESGHTLSQDVQDGLLNSLYAEALRLNRLLSNLLDITRLESPSVQIQQSWQSLEELVGAALLRLEAKLAGRPIEIDIPADLPLISVDGVLIEQLLINLLENADRYTPAHSPIAIRASVKEAGVVVEIADQGPGLAPGEEKRIFERFYRGTGTAEGVGLGLTICQAIVKVHHGSIVAENRAAAGCVVRVTLPLWPAPPVDLEEGAV